MGCVRSKQAIGNLFSFYFANKTVFRHKTKCLFPKRSIIGSHFPHTAVTGIENKRHKMFS